MKIIEISFCFNLNKLDISVLLNVFLETWLFVNYLSSSAIFNRIDSSWIEVTSFDVISFQQDLTGLIVCFLSFVMNQTFLFDSKSINKRKNNSLKSYLKSIDFFLLSSKLCFSWHMQIETLQKENNICY